MVSSVKVTRTGKHIACIVWIVLGMQPAHAALMAELEGPLNNQPVSGIGIIRGWAFSDTVGSRISQVTLRIDGKDITTIPCCGERADVQGAFPQFPADNTRNSGFGITFNYGNLSAGAHTLEVAIQDSGGAQFNRAHTITVVKAGDFSYIDQVDLNGATAELQEGDVVMTGLRVRDKASQQEKRVNARLRWFQNTQALGLVDSSTSAAIARSTGSAEQRSERPAQTAKTSVATSIRYAALESPDHGDTGSGIAIIRGWVIAPLGKTIQRVQLFIDDAPSMTLPCCSPRSDVAAAYPTEPNAANSGFGGTFNYGNLAQGNHDLTVEIEDSDGGLRKLTRGIVVRSPGDFSFSEQVDFGMATVRVSGGELAVTNALVKDRVTEQTAFRSLRYRWDVPAQNFTLVDEGTTEITITSQQCTVNGDVSNLDALRTNPGPDGLSLPELLAAMVSSRWPGRVMADFSAGGIIRCNRPLPTVVGPLSLNGDVNGDGNPDVVLEGETNVVSATDARARDIGLPAIGFDITGSDVTLRKLSITHFVEYGIRVTPVNGTEISNVAVLRSEISESGTGIHLGVGGDSGKTIRNVLIGKNTINQIAGNTNIEVDVCCSLGATISGLTIAGNHIENLDNADENYGVSIGPGYQAKGSILDRIKVIANMIISKNNDKGIQLVGGFDACDDNLIEAVISENLVNNAGVDRARDGITVVGGLNASNNNILMVDIRDNNLEKNGDFGIYAAGGIEDSKNNTIEITIEGNLSQEDGIGINISGSEGGSDHQILATIQGNETKDSGYAGIYVDGGVESSGNAIQGRIVGNHVTSAEEGISLAGGFAKASNNLLDTTVQNNLIKNITATGLSVAAGWFAIENNLNTVISDNTVNNSESGITVCGGTTKERESNSSPANNNLTLATIIKNIIQGNLINRIAVFGGCDNAYGEVTGNRATASIDNNIADNIICEDNIAGNMAECTISSNINTNALSSMNNYYSKTLPISHAGSISSMINKRLEIHRNTIIAKENEIRARAEQVGDQRLRERLLRLSDRLRAARNTGIFEHSFD